MVAESKGLGTFGEVDFRWLSCLADGQSEILPITVGFHTFP